MVEMRYVLRSEPIHETSPGVLFSQKVKVLQYRYPIDKAQWGPIWSEWIDVPTVEEGK